MGPMFVFIPWIVSFLTAITTFLTSYFTRKVANVLAFIAIIGLIIVSFVSALNLAIAAIRVSSPTGAFIVGLGGFLPNNTVLCVSTYLSVLIATRVFEYAYGFTARFISDGF